MNRKMKYIVICICIVAMIGIATGVRAIYNFCRIEAIYSNLIENVKKDNYYIKTTIHNGDEVSNIEIYYKDGIGKQKVDSGLYTWVNKDDAYLVDEENKILYSLETENSTVLVSSEMFASLYPFYSKSKLERFFFAGNLQNKIKNVKYNDAKCLFIKTKKDKIEKSIWINKNRNEIIHAEVKFPNGGVIKYDYDLQFNVTKIRDIEMPDTSDYKILEYTK